MHCKQQSCHSHNLHVHVQVVQSLLHNAHMSLEPYLHQLIPCVLTCLVAKSLGTSPAEDHWAVRDAAARLLEGIIAKFGAAYADLQPRISRQLLKAFLDPAKPLTTHYGDCLAAIPTSSYSVFMPTCLKQHV